MGLSLAYFIVSFGSSISGLPLSLIGSSLCKKRSDNRGMQLGNKAASLNVLPLPLSLVLFYLITALFGLNLSE